MEIDQAGLPRDRPPELLALANATWKAATRNVRISQLHSEVSQALKELGEEHEMEYLVEGELFSLDMAIPGKLDAMSLRVQQLWTLYAARAESKPVGLNTEPT